MSKYIQLTITDTLSFWDNYIETYTFNPDSKSHYIVWNKLPDDWLDNNKLKKDKLEIILRQLYGENWRMGNDDGSMSQILGLDENILSAEQSLQKPWLDGQGICYVISEDGVIQSCEKDKF